MRNKRAGWTDRELKRMKTLVELSGLSWSVIGQRFGCGASTVADLAKKHKWKKKIAGAPTRADDAEPKAQHSGNRQSLHCGV